MEERGAEGRLRGGPGEGRRGVPEGGADGELTGPSAAADADAAARAHPTAVDSDPAVRWFAVWTRSRHEQVVREQLVGRGYEVFLPTVTRWSRWKDRKKRIDWPLFPGYCFARFDPAARVPILACPGVASIVSVGAQPAPIPDAEIDAIRRLVDSDLRYDPCPMIVEGSVVEVVSGPLRGVVGRLLRKGAHARLVLSVELIGQAVSAEVDAADVRPY